ncbi:sulfotransferase domain-containing protein [Mariniflexile sp. HMF6888]|uniref:sulfotransferase domain-containing protein n=1 Tax=Mariniflexile sp. HMF6888 TaxID=3373086 RepID=UPI00379D0E87
MFKENNKVYHMASMARSGETLMLKILAVHPNIEIVHNLEKNDNVNKERAFQFLKTYKKETISRTHPVIRPYNLDKNKILLLKQGVWKHPYPFKGFILSRNPVSIYASLKTYDKELPQYNKNDNFWEGNEERFFRWLKDINKKSIPLFNGKTPVEQFCLFYNLRMKQLLDTKLPVIRYEDLLLNTKQTLENVCSILKIDMNDKLLSAHSYYDAGFEGHGKNDLSKPIDTASLIKYRQDISEEEFDFISKNTYETYTLYGYKLEKFNVEML